MGRLFFFEREGGGEIGVIGIIGAIGAIGAISIIGNKKSYRQMPITPIILITLTPLKY